MPEHTTNWDHAIGSVMAVLTHLQKVFSVFDAVDFQVVISSWNPSRVSNAKFVDHHERKLFGCDLTVLVGTVFWS